MFKVVLVPVGFKNFNVFIHKLEVRRFKINETLIVPLKCFKVKEKPFSISFSKNTLAIEIGEGSNGSIIVTDMDGDQLKKISGNRRHFGMFTGNTIRLAHDHDAGCLYVVDISKEYVNCVDYEGNSTASFSFDCWHAINLG
jgi:hypothetical protein